MSADPAAPSPPKTNVSNDFGPRDSRGWDGKLRVDRRAVLTNPEALSDPDYSDGDAPPINQIEADEGSYACFKRVENVGTNYLFEDLLEEYEPDADVYLFSTALSVFSCK
jgi:hypothetical protein